MNVLALTIFVGLLLAGFFIVLWVASALDHRQFNERDALLPLDADITPPPPRNTEP